MRGGAEGGAAGDGTRSSSGDSSADAGSGDSSAAGSGQGRGGANDSGAGSALAGAQGLGGASAGESGLGGAPCEGPAPSAPDLTTGVWLVCGALASNDRIWDGAFTFDEPTPTCTGAKLTGKVHWVTSNLGASDGTTVFAGSYDASTGRITLDEYEVVGGNVVTATDTMSYDADSDTFVDGGWTCSCSPGTWTTATHEPPGTDVESCQ